MSYDRPGRDDYRDWRDSVDREWERREHFERLDEQWEKNGEVEPEDQDDEQ